MKHEAETNAALDAAPKHSGATTDRGAGSSRPGDEIALDPTTQILLGSHAGDRQTLRRAALAAILVHLALLLVTFPNLASPKKLAARKEQKAFVVQQVRFQPPAPREQKEIPKPKTKRIPIPDPTPDDPEPIVLDELPEPDFDVPDIDGVNFGIPDAPNYEEGVGGDGPLEIANGVIAPVKIFSPQPQYTEEARQGRIQGTVILQAVIGADGSVSSAKVLKGLPLGLNESAIKTVKEWTYQPATLDGKPVAVYLTLLINFSLQ